MEVLLFSPIDQEICFLEIIIINTIKIWVPYIL